MFTTGLLLYVPDHASHLLVNLVTAVTKWRAYQDENLDQVTVVNGRYLSVVFRAACVSSLEVVSPMDGY